MRGVSLLETVVATALFLMISILLMNLFPTALLGLKVAEQRSRAEGIAQAALIEEQGRALGPAVTLDLAPQEWDGVRFTPHLEVFDVAATSRPRLRGMRVTVRWRDHDTDKTAVRERWLSNVFTN